MSLVSASPRTLGDVVPGGLVRNVALVVGGTLLVALGAQIVVPLPFTPVPLSLSTFGVLLTGAALGSRRGALSMLLYVLVGMAGVPWFTNHNSGFMFASFGYAAGFVAAGWLAGRLAERGADRQVLKTFGLMVAGSAVIYVFGVTGLMLYTGMGLGDALAKGVAPFVVGDLLKSAAAAALLPAAWKLVGARGR